MQCIFVEFQNKYTVLIVVLMPLASVYACTLHSSCTMLLLFCRPKSDTCKTCDALHVQISAEGDPAAKSLLESELKLHHCKAERAYQQLKEDTTLLHRLMWTCSPLTSRSLCQHLKFQLMLSFIRDSCGLTT